MEVKLNYFPAHFRGLMIRMVIAHLDFGEWKIADNFVLGTDFKKDQKKYGGEFGQMPCILRPDGLHRGQTLALVRFFAM